MLDFTGFHPVTNPQSATKVNDQTSRHITHLSRLIMRQQISGILDVVPGLTRLMISFDPTRTDGASIKQAVGYLLHDTPKEVSSDRRHWALPICYDEACGPDIAAIAKATSLSQDEVIARHLASCFEVTVMGFMPGLGYMTGLDSTLTLPRLAKPRTHVPARSVGIAIGQCVIYPMESPGGWHLIGQTSIRVFDPNRQEPILFRAGDLISFRRISYDDLRDQEQSYNAQTFCATDFQRQG